MTGCFRNASSQVRPGEGAALRPDSASLDFGTQGSLCCGLFVQQNLDSYTAGLRVGKRGRQTSLPSHRYCLSTASMQNQ